MKIGVFAGTSRDTQMGVDILEKEGFETLSYPFSKNPKEQTNMQYYSKEKLEELFTEKLRDAKNKGASSIFVYCNSLSSALDYKKIARKEDIQIITPLESYEQVGGKNICILAANALSAYKIDMIINKANKEADTISIGMMRLVNLIEENLEAEEIVKRLDLKGFLKYLENIGIDSLVLGCTHFPYIKDQLRNLSKIEIIDPKDYMLREIYSKNL